MASRRHFLVASGLSALAASRAFGSNDAIRYGAIGCGGRMRSLLSAADQYDGARLVAGCDVYQPRAEEIRTRTNGQASVHNEYHELLEKKDVDVVIIASPNHWHVRMACDAIAAGKDVYLEKPVTHTFEEADVLSRAVHGSNRILQSGMQQRSWLHFQSAVDLIQGGAIGRITQIRTYWYQNYQRNTMKPVDVRLLDWKRWLGPAQEQPFSEEKFYLWRWFWDFGGGAMTDLFTHWVDVAHWAMKEDTPQTAFTIGNNYVFTTWHCPDTIQSAMHYNGFQVGYEGTLVSSIDDGGLDFRGTLATLKINRSGFTIDREGRHIQNPVLSERSIEDGTITHMANFFDCVRSRKQPNAPVETGIAAARAGQIGNVALRRNAQVSWPLTKQS